MKSELLFDKLSCCKTHIICVIWRIDASIGFFIHLGYFVYKNGSHTKIYLFVLLNHYNVTFCLSSEMYKNKMRSVKAVIFSKSYKKRFIGSEICIYCSFPLMTWCITEGLQLQKTISELFTISGFAKQ